MTRDQIVNNVSNGVDDRRMHLFIYRIIASYAPREVVLFAVWSRVLDIKTFHSIMDTLNLNQMSLQKW